MKSDVVIWTDVDDKLKVVLGSYSDGEKYVRLDIKTIYIRNLSVYMSPKQAIEVWNKLGKLKLIGENDAKHK